MYKCKKVPVPILRFLMEGAVADLAREYRLVEELARLRVVVEAHLDLLVQAHTVLAVDQPRRQAVTQRDRLDKELAEGERNVATQHPLEAGLFLVGVPRALGVIREG